MYWLVIEGIGMKKMQSLAIAKIIASRAQHTRRIEGMEIKNGMPIRIVKEEYIYHHINPVEDRDDQ